MYVCVYVYICMNMYDVCVSLLFVFLITSTYVFEIIYVSTYQLIVYTVHTAQSRSVEIANTAATATLVV